MPGVELREVLAYIESRLMNEGLPKKKVRALTGRIEELADKDAKDRNFRDELLNFPFLLESLVYVEFEKRKNGDPRKEFEGLIRSLQDFAIEIEEKHDSERTSSLNLLCSAAIHDGLSVLAQELSRDNQKEPDVTATRKFWQSCVKFQASKLKKALGRKGRDPNFENDLKIHAMGVGAKKPIGDHYLQNNWIRWSTSFAEHFPSKSIENGALEDGLLNVLNTMYGLARNAQKRATGSQKTLVKRENTIRSLDDAIKRLTKVSYE